ncbi:MAG: hypothetical protein O3C40_12720 [Planctomycetota bacterium]|nr:hypothetical protein [Planctomycetota bacterium]
MACDATARLYDVDEDSVVFVKLQKTEKYDLGTVTFRARKDKLIDLDQLHESIWATRLSSGTRSGLVSLEVTVIGEVVAAEDKTVLKVSGSDKEFVLGKHSDEQHAAAFAKLQSSAGKSVKLTGIIDDYVGRWPNVLKTQPTTPRRVLVTGVELAE